jgi:peptidoglycan/xylan/chitin deacetylase (PgdA/CDA1 family)
MRAAAISPADRPPPGAPPAPRRAAGAIGSLQAARRAAATAVKRGLGGVAVAPGAARRTRRSIEQSTNIVFAHLVGPPAPHYASFYAGLDVRRLDRELARLGRWFTFAPLDAVLAGSASGRGGRPPLAVTFDDGFAMGADVRAVLERHGVSATVFAITGCIGNDDLMWRSKLSAIVAQTHERVLLDAYRGLAAEHGLLVPASGACVMDASGYWPMADKDALAGELWRRCGMAPLDEYLDRHRPYFTWDGLREWIAAGHAVGLHTRTHPYCALLGPDEIQDEIVAAAAHMRDELGGGRPPLSYPFGSRLRAEAEERLVDDGVVSCALGIDGFAPRGTPPQRLERASLEGDLRWEVFGRTLLRPVRAQAASILPATSPTMFLAMELSRSCGLA